MSFNELDRTVQSDFQIVSRGGPNLIITGISRSGTSYLCNLLHRFSNCVIINEPAEAFATLIDDVVPWRIARLYQQLRADIASGRGILNKLQGSEVAEDTLLVNHRRVYLPQVENADFVLGTKHTQPYLMRLNGLRRVLPEARIVICVRNPFDTIASWKTSFPHLRDAAVTGMRVGHPRDRALTAPQLAALELIASTQDVAQRRAMWWNFMAETVLTQQHDAILVRYPDLVAKPDRIVRRILEGLPAGALREPITPSAVRSKRDELDAADEQAIQAMCSRSAAELGVSEPDEKAL